MADNEPINRLKEDERNKLNRKKRKNNSGDVMKEMNKKRKLQETPIISGSLKYYVSNQQEKTEFMNKVDKAKLCVNENISNVSNYEILNNALDYFLKHHGSAETAQTTSVKSDAENHYKPYLYSEQNDTQENMFLCTKSALNNLISGIDGHRTECEKSLIISQIMTFGHVGKLIMNCQNGHCVKVDTSPHIEGGKYLANLRIIHGVKCSGLRYIQYERFCKAAGLGICSETMFSDMEDIYCKSTEDTAKESVEDALNMEIGQAIANVQDPSEFSGIDIITDARHGTRKNSAYSDVIALGGTTHKIVSAQEISKQDDPISQRHELIGVKKMYQEFDNKNVSVRIHGHDRNSSVNKYLSQEHTHVQNANDTWHATKGIIKVLKSITSGPKKMHGITWHGELTDKAASVKTAAYYAMKNCNGSGEKLRQMLDNIPEHYKGNHTQCLPQSKCKQEERYVCSKSELKDPKAISLLSAAIKKLQIYRTPEDYAACVDTHYVESFNNATLIYHVKRITFGEKEYKRRTNLSICDWNENVDRDCTSIVLFEDVKNPRRRVGHKNLKPKTYAFVNKIWNNVITQVYTC